MKLGRAWTKNIAIIVVAGVLIQNVGLPLSYADGPVIPPAAGGAGESTAKVVGKAVAGATAETVEDVGKTTILYKTFKGIGWVAKYLGNKVGVAVTVDAAVATTLALAIAFRQVTVGYEELRDFQHAYAERAERYNKRLWTFYLSDPKFFEKIPQVREAALNWVNGGCEKKHLNCGIDYRQVFLSPDHLPHVKIGTVLNQQTCIFQVPADDFILDNAVQAVALHLAELVGDCQLRRTTFDIAKNYNDDGTTRHWYSLPDAELCPATGITCSDGEALFAFDLLGLPNEIPRGVTGTYPDHRTGRDFVRSYFDSGVPDKYFQVDWSFTRYRRDFAARDDKGQIFDYSAKNFITNGIRFRLQKITYWNAFWEGGDNDVIVLTRCGRPGTDALFYEKLEPCHVIIPSPKLRDKTLEAERYIRGQVHKIGNIDDNSYAHQRNVNLIRYSIDTAGGFLLDAAIMGLVAKWIKRSKPIADLGVETVEAVAPAVEAAAAEAVAKKTWWTAVKASWVGAVGRWTGKTVKVVGPYALNMVNFAAGTKISDIVVGERIPILFPEEKNDDIELLYGLHKTAAIMQNQFTSDVPNDDTAKLTFGEFDKLLNSENKMTVEVLQSLEDKYTDPLDPDIKSTCNFVETLHKQNGKEFCQAEDWSHIDICRIVDARLEGNDLKFKIGLLNSRIGSPFPEAPIKEELFVNQVEANIPGTNYFESLKALQAISMLRPLHCALTGEGKNPETSGNWAQEIAAGPSRVQLRIENPQFTFGAPAPNEELPGVPATLTGSRLIFPGSK